MGKKKKHREVSHDEVAGFKKIKKKKLKDKSALKLKSKRRRRAKRNKRSAIRF